MPDEITRCHPDDGDQLSMQACPRHVQRFRQSFNREIFITGMTLDATPRSFEQTAGCAAVTVEARTLDYPPKPIVAVPCGAVDHRGVAKALQHPQRVRQAGHLLDTHRIESLTPYTSISLVHLPSPIGRCSQTPEWPARANVPAICFPQIHRKHARAGVRTNCLTSQLDNNCAPCCNRCANGCSGDELRRESRWRAAHSVMAVTGVHTAIPTAAKAARSGGKAGNA